MKKLIMTLLLLSGCYAQTLKRPVDHTDGQKLLAQDTKVIEDDLAACKRTVVGSEKRKACMDLIQEEKQQLIGLDAQILSAEITHEKTVVWNKAHPEHQYADVEDVIAEMLEFHRKLESVFQETRKALK